MFGENKKALKSGKISHNKYERIVSKPFKLLQRYFQEQYRKFAEQPDSPELLSSYRIASEEAGRAARSAIHTHRDMLIGYRIQFLKKAIYVDRLLKNNTGQPELDENSLDDVLTLFKENKEALESGKISDNEYEQIFNENLILLLGCLQARYTGSKEKSASPELLSSCIEASKEAERAAESFCLTQDNWGLPLLMACRSMLLTEAGYIASQLKNNTEALARSAEVLKARKDAKDNALFLLPNDNKLLSASRLVRTAITLRQRARFFIKKRERLNNEGGNPAHDASEHSSQEDNTAS